MTNNAKPASGSQTAERKKRLLLLVDGNASDMLYTGILLQRLEYTIYTAKTAEEALEIMGITLPSLVLTEITLPKMNGIDLLKQIKQELRTRRIPVIVYTALKDPAHKTASLRAGCADFLTKPAEPNALYAAIQDATEATPRHFVRLKTYLDVIVGDERAAANTPTAECITAISENGIYVNSPSPLPVGAAVPLTIFLKNAKIRVEGKVLYSFAKGKGPMREPGMGVKFERISPQDKDLIRAFIREQLVEDIGLRT